jgi:MarR family transcriptional regulator, organic hydroperoxide resistance regulator
MDYELLKLDNQLCFPAYAASRLIIREYQSYLNKLGLTYPQYLVLLILWEKDNVPIKNITSRLLLNTNTVTPLLKRMEKQGFIKRKRTVRDERKVLLRLTHKGEHLKKKAAAVQEKVSSGLLSGSLNRKDLESLKMMLEKVVETLS